MAHEKTIIFKNTITEPITITELGITIEVGENSYAEYEEILAIETSDELVDFINSEIIVVNDGTQDLAPIPALEYLQIGSNFIQNYYSKEETDTIINNIVVNNITNIENQLIEDYYTKNEVNTKLSEIEGYGIVGGVDDINDLPENYTGNVGDIYIVRMSVGLGSGGPAPYTANTDTGLYLPMETSWEDELGHEGESNSSMNPVSSPLTPPFGTNYCDFDGHNDYLEFDENHDFGEGPTLTVGGWIYPREGKNRGIIGRWDDGDGWKIDLYGNKLRASLDTLSMSPVQFKDSNSISLNEWTHVAMVYDGNYCILYRNATEVNRVSASGTTIDSYDEDVLVGKWMGGGDDDDEDEDEDEDEGNSKYFNGGMKDFFIQNSAMTQEQLQHLVTGNFESFADEGFYQWDGNEWVFLARNTGENGGGSGSSYHNSLLGLNSDDYQHLTQNEKLGLTDGGDTSLHTHDDRYYTESEIDSKMQEKANTSHTHSNIYTKSEVDSAINNITFSDISSNDSSTNVTGAELESLTNGSNADHLHTHTGTGSGGGTGGLDDAYDNHSQHSQGSGREISVDFGPISLEASNGFAPLRLQEIDYVPSQWLNTGHICVYDSELFIYDATRSCWNSVSGYYIGGGFNSNNIKNTYLKGYNGGPFTDNVGWVAPWDGVVVAMSVSSNKETWQAIELRKNGNSTSAKVWYNHNKKAWSKDIDVKFSEGDVLNFYATENADDCNQPQVWAIIKRVIS